MYYNTDDEEEFEAPTLETLDISNDKYYQNKSEVTIATPDIPSQDVLAGGDDNNFGCKRKFRQPSDSSKEIACQSIPLYGSKTIRHSLPAYDLWRQFYPTHLNEEKFRKFHRPQLRHYNQGLQSRQPFAAFHRPIPIKSLTRMIYRNQKRLKSRVMSDIRLGLPRERIISRNLLILNARNLTAKEGELFLFEYSEEFPPVLSQNGMASNIKTYIQQQQMPPSAKNLKGVSKLSQSTKDNASPTKVDSPMKNSVNLGYVEVLNQKAEQVYYNKLKPGSQVQMIENNLYRAPIYAHASPSCDFLIIRTRNSIYVRSVDNIFTVGQTMPLKTTLIPKPTEKSIQKFRCDLSNIYIHKLLKESHSDPPTFNLGQLMKLFPDYHRSVLINRLKTNGARYVQNDIFYCGTSKYGSLTDREIRNILTPEDYCINMAMLAARERLRELNYTESMIDPPTDVELETEVLAAPWNTTKAVSNSLKNKSYLDLKNHTIDPTGIQREGFSCVAWSKSPTEDQQAREQLESRLKFDKSEQATQPFQAKNPMAAKITREKLERLAIYQKEAQIISEVQSRVLSSCENLSSDEEEEEDVEDENILDTSFDEQLKDLDKLLSGKTKDGLIFEKEEEERQKMIKEFSGKHVETQNKQDSPDSSSDPLNVVKYQDKILKIIRTYECKKGLLERTEIVRDPRIIALYVKHKADRGKDIRDKSNVVERDTEDVIMEGTNNDFLNKTTATCGGFDKSPETYCSSQKKRRSSVSLGPSELCRADGMVLTISKKVLESARKRFPRSCKDMSF